MPASKLKLNLSEARSFKPVPDDTYPAKISQVKDVQKGPKASYVPIEFEITEGEFAGRKFYQNYMVDGAAAGMFVEFINKVLGTDHDVDELEDLDLDPNDLIGAACAIVLKQEEYPEGSGEMRSQIKKVLSAGAAKKKVSEDEEESEGSSRRRRR